MIKSITSAARDLGGLFFPNNCRICSKSLSSKEDVFCIGCELELPKTNFHQQADNLTAKHLWGRIDVKAAASFLYFEDGNITQEAIHQLKYQGKKQVGAKLGQLYAQQLKDDDSDFAKVDLIVPIPLYYKKYRKRGYNQSDSIAEGLSNGLNIPWDKTVAERVKGNISQTMKSKYDRWDNVEDIFKIVKPPLVNNKHILLVDDVITTGATIEACASALLKEKNVTVSVLTIGYAV